MSTRKKRKPVPVAVINELKTAVALRGYSEMTEVDPMSIRQQYKWMEDFYHGKGETHPSQVSLLEKGVGVYADFYDSKPIQVTDKNYSGSPYQLTLKEELFVLNERKFVAGLDITASELEKRSRNTKILMSGRSIYDLAKRSLRKHKKAIGFSAELWDLDKNEPLNSGTTQADCIEHVRKKMYFYLSKKKQRRKDGEETDSSDDEKARNEEDDLLSQISRQIRTNENDDNSATVVAEIVDGDDANNTLDPMPPLPNMSRKEREELERAGDADYDPQMEGNEDNDEEDENEGGDNDIDEDQVPAGWTFPGFMSFVVWGPFAVPSVRLKTVLINGLKRSDVLSRAQMRKKKKIDKEVERSMDTTNERGLTTDQMISLQNVQVQRDRLNTHKDEVAIASLMMQNTILKDQIAQYEKRAERMCPTYNEKNVHWARVDGLYLQQEGLLSTLTKLRTQLLNKEVDKASDNFDNEVIDIGNETDKGVIEINGNQEDQSSQLTSTTPRVPSEILTTKATSSKTSKSPSLTIGSTPRTTDQTPTDEAPQINDKATTSKTSKTQSLTIASTAPTTDATLTDEAQQKNDNVTAAAEIATNNLSYHNNSSATSQRKSMFARRLPITTSCNYKGKYQFNGNPINFCAAGMMYCMAPHVEIGSLVIHKCAVCKQKLHTHCVATNDDGVMTCAACDDVHSYACAISCAHPVQDSWKSDLVNYFKDRNGIPKDMSFLAGVYHLENVQNSNKATGRKTKNSRDRSVSTLGPSRKSRRRVSGKR